MLAADGGSIVRLGCPRRRRFWLSILGDGVSAIEEELYGGESWILRGLKVILGESRTICGES
jgi:hypothetical protein